MSGFRKYRMMSTKYVEVVQEMRSMYTVGRIQKYAGAIQRMYTK